MHQARVTRIIDAPRDDVWTLVSDLTTVDKWNPNVRSVDLLSTNKSGHGASRVCNFEDGTSVKEKVKFDDGKHLNIQLSEYSAPMKKFVGDFYAVPKGANKTEITFALTYAVKYGPVGYLLGATVVKAQMKKLMETVLAGLDYHIATGQLVGKDTVLPKQ